MEDAASFPQSGGHQAIGHGSGPANPLAWLAQIT